MLYIKADNVYDLYEKHAVRTHILFPDTVFDNTYESAWLNSEIGREILTKVEHIDFMPGEDAEQAFRRLGFLPKELSTGAKNLFLCAFYVENQRILLTKMGANCFELLFKITAEKDIKISVTNYVSFLSFVGNVANCWFEDLNKIATTKEDLVSLMFELSDLGVWK